MSVSRVYKQVFRRRARGWRLSLLKLIRSRKAAWQTFITSADSDIVLASLARYCNANRTTFVTDNDSASFLLEGRRQVWLYINEMISLDEQRLAELIKSGERKAGQ